MPWNNKCAGENTHFILKASRKLDNVVMRLFCQLPFQKAKDGLSILTFKATWTQALKVL